MSDQNVRFSTILTIMAFLYAAFTCILPATTAADSGEFSPLTKRLESFLQHIEKIMPSVAEDPDFKALSSLAGSSNENVTLDKKIVPDMVIKAIDRSLHTPFFDLLATAPGTDVDELSQRVKSAVEALESFKKQYSEFFKESLQDTMNQEVLAGSMDSAGDVDQEKTMDVVATPQEGMHEPLAESGKDQNTPSQDDELSLLGEDGDQATEEASVESNETESAPIENVSATEDRKAEATPTPSTSSEEKEAEKGSGSVDEEKNVEQSAASTAPTEPSASAATTQVEPAASAENSVAPVASEVPAASSTPTQAPAAPTEITAPTAPTEPSASAATTQVEPTASAENSVATVLTALEIPAATPTPTPTTSVASSQPASAELPTPDVSAASTASSATPAAPVEPSTPAVSTPAPTASEVQAVNNTPVTEATPAAPAEPSASVASAPLSTPAA